MTPDKPWLTDPDYFAKQGAKGGKLGGSKGGKTAAANMTAAERTARATKGGKGLARSWKKKASAKKAKG